ncbi:hypothetical protein ACSBR2_029171 [Camellia fascicularis]
MSDMISENDHSLVESKSSFSISQIEEVKTWLVCQFDGDSISHLHNLATLSQANTQAALIVANDLHQKASEYRSQAARIREILESVGLAKESLPPNMIASTQVLAIVANLLDIRDTKLSRWYTFNFLVAEGDISLKKNGVEEKRNQLQRESKILLDRTRKAITRLTYLKRTLQLLEDEVSPYEAQMEKLETNLAIMAAKEQQYMLQHANHKTIQQLEAKNPHPLA